MELKNISILAGKIGKDVTVSYYDILNSRSVTLEDDETPHPDLMKVFKALCPYFESAIAPDSGIGERFVPTTIKISESDGEFFVTVSGKFKTEEDDTINMSSGKMSMDSNESLQIAVSDIKFELYQYFFKGKGAQGKLEFKEQEKQDKKEAIKTSVKLDDKAAAKMAVVV